MNYFCLNVNMLTTFLIEYIWLLVVLFACLYNLYWSYPLLLVFDPTLYRNTIGVLQYLAFTRPDIAFAMNKVSQFMNYPLDDHWTTVKQLLRYVKATASHGLSFKGITNSLLHRYSNSNWGEMWMIKYPQLVLLYFLVITWSLSLRKSNELSLGPALRLSIGQ